MRPIEKKMELQKKISDIIPAPSCIAHSAQINFVKSSIDCLLYYILSESLHHVICWCNVFDIPDIAIKQAFGFKRFSFPSCMPATGFDIINSPVTNFQQDRLDSAFSFSQDGCQTFCPAIQPYLGGKKMDSYQSQGYLRINKCNDLNQIQNNTQSLNASLQHISIKNHF